MTPRDLEPEIRRIGRELLERVGDRRTSIFDPAGWGGQVMEWAVRDDAFKTALFRFVYVLPTLPDPAEAVAHGDMPELERLMLHELAKRATIVRNAYAEFDYKTVVATLAAFMNTELSAFYFDIRKDTLYCDPPSSTARKAALTAIDIICDAILRWLAPGNPG